MILQSCALKCNESQEYARICVLPISLYVFKQVRLQLLASTGYRSVFSSVYVINQ